MSDNTRLRIAIQKSGRLADDSFALFSGCGMKIRQRNQRLTLLAENMPVEILLVRDDDIPGLVMGKQPATDRRLYSYHNSDAALGLFTSGP